MNRNDVTEQGGEFPEREGPSLQDALIGRGPWGPMPAGFGLLQWRPYSSKTPTMVRDPSSKAVNSRSAKA